MKKEEKTMKGYKATNKDMICNPDNNPFKYELGKWNKENKAELCNRGFHFCENPLDILNYYDLTSSRFFEIEAKKVSDEINSEDTKRVSKEIKLSAELNLKGLINDGFKFIREKATENNNIDTNNNIVNENNSSQVATSGNSSQVAIDGDYSIGMCAGQGSIIKGKKGNWITLAEWEYDDKIDKYIPICVKSARIDGIKLKENTFYKLENKKFVEVKDDNN